LEIMEELRFGEPVHEVLCVIHNDRRVTVIVLTKTKYGGLGNGTIGSSSSRVRWENASSSKGFL
jgi:hypothetical protein